MLNYKKTLTLLALALVITQTTHSMSWFAKLNFFKHRPATLKLSEKLCWLSTGFTITAVTRVSYLGYLQEQINIATQNQYDQLANEEITQEAKNLISEK